MHKSWHYSTVHTKTSSNF